MKPYVLINGESSGSISGTMPDGDGILPIKDDVCAGDPRITAFPHGGA